LQVTRDRSNCLSSDQDQRLPEKVSVDEITQKRNGSYVTLEAMENLEKTLVDSSKNS